MTETSNDGNVVENAVKNARVEDEPDVDTKCLFVLFHYKTITGKEMVMYTKTDPAVAHFHLVFRPRANYTQTVILIPEEADRIWGDHRKNCALVRKPFEHVIIGYRKTIKRNEIILNVIGTTLFPGCQKYTEMRRDLCDAGFDHNKQVIIKSDADFGTNSIREGLVNQDWLFNGNIWFNRYHICLLDTYTSTYDPAHMQINPFSLLQCFHLFVI